MSRRRGENGPAVTLFPFLAVIICLIGALVLMLLLSSSKIRSDAITAARAARAAHSSAAPSAPLEEPAVEDGGVDEETAKALLEMRLADARGKQSSVAAALNQRRLELAGIEDHMRKLEDERRLLVAAVEDLNRIAQDKGRNHEDQVKRVADLKETLTDKEKAIAEAKDAARNRPKAYAILPYDGPNGTKRQPIYIECRADAVYLQPQGIALPPADFDMTLGEQNALASAVRAMSESIILNGKLPDGSTPQPYPLLIVHPDGITAYYAAKEALPSWVKSSQFGYELIGPDTPLVFPPVDPTLGSVAQRSIQEARSRQKQLSSLAPGMYAGGGRNGGGGGGGGDGFARVTGIGVPGNSGSKKPQRYTVGVGNQGLVPYRGGLPGDDEEESGGEGGYAGGPSGHFGGPARPGGPVGNGQGNVYGGNGPGGNGPGGPGGNGMAGGAGMEGSGGPGGPNRTGSGLAGANGNPGMNGAAGASGGGGTSGGYAGSPANAAAAGNGNVGGGGGSPPTQIGNTGIMVSGAAPNGARGQQGAGAGSYGRGQAGGGGGGDPNGPKQAPPKLGEYVESQDPYPRPDPAMQPPKKPKPDPRNLAEERGENWALLDYKATSISIRKDVRILVEADQITISPNKTPIPMPGPTHEVVDPMVKQIQSQIRTWGIAGKGMYWRPAVVIETTRGAEDRFEELKQLLEGSGLEIRSEEWTVVRDAPLRR